ncbi:Zn-dependent hydrolase [Brevibacillus laterosporus]|uniref:Zn-dependent hydrolase n=1 Tax=Brevibacillus laterosporus TaxID=1465 RepID=UPI000E6C5DF3|nr:Zn-dependent hydrolase [Brevibacillus laterosporus]AYB38043.1 Zn-dependent hydrolase [Brevibacillus laterosporus]MBM7110630.1 Hydantoin utilization protein C [Brevibacillus laterosporus]
MDTYKKQKHVLDSPVQIKEQRIDSRLRQLGEIGRTMEQGVTRLALTDEDMAAQRIVASWMEEAGMRVRKDCFGNLIGRKEGNNPHAPVVMLGSHIDSVPNGGRFDGTVGVIGGIEVVQVLHENNVQHDHPIEVVAFCDEEGVRFSDGFFGSRGMCGKLTPEDLKRHDNQGMTRMEALQQCGFPSQQSGSDVLSSEEIKAYLELHIEQGPYLQAVNEPVGIVTSIMGVKLLSIKLMGQSGHAGTVPMNMRHDPIMAAAEAILGIEKICSADASKPTVGTVGTIGIEPGACNVIPGSVELTVDIRDIDESRLLQILTDIEALLSEISLRRGLEYQIENVLAIKKADAAAELVQMFREIGLRRQNELPEMYSGAGHDAMILSEITQMGMLFVRCKDGISHHPDEWSHASDICLGVEYLYEAVCRLAT